MTTFGEGSSKRGRRHVHRARRKKAGHVMHLAGKAHARADHGIAASVVAQPPRPRVAAPVGDATRDDEARLGKARRDGAERFDQQVHALVLAHLPDEDDRRTLTAGGGVRLVVQDALRRPVVDHGDAPGRHAVRAQRTRDELRIRDERVGSPDDEAPQQAPDPVVNGRLVAGAETPSAPSGMPGRRGNSARRSG
jgi:hypothetical protein